ncbi:hypothetical protein EQV77_16685 [Halobacillus fulvus]|nr:hypothetical protein EQV77_16685 [Halobacillus fulvus]
MSKECEKVLDYINGQLTEIERKQFEKHMETCSDCREEVEELRELMEDLPYSSEPVEPPEGMKDRVLGAVFAEESSAPEPESSVQKEDQTVTHHREHHTNQQEKSKRPKPSWLMRGLVAALALSLLGNLYAVISEPGQETVDEGVLPSESTDTISQRVQLQGEATEANATAAVIRQNEESLLTIQADQLEQLQGESVYQVWLITGETPYRAGTFVANESGEGAVAFSMDQLPEDVDWNAVAISVEPDATSETPQGEVILSSSL